MRQDLRPWDVEPVAWLASWFIQEAILPAYFSAGVRDRRRL